MNQWSISGVVLVRQLEVDINYKWRRSCLFLIREVIYNGSANVKISELGSKTNNNIIRTSVS